jgi:hypothetical protein
MEFGDMEYDIQTQSYSNCACISDATAAGSSAQYVTDGDTDSVTIVPIARSGPCPQTCRAMIPFLIILFIVTLVVSITQMPLLMVTLRYVCHVSFRVCLFDKLNPDVFLFFSIPSSIIALLLRVSGPSVRRSVPLHWGCNL